MRDALRLSRGMSYKNAMAGLPMGGGKAVILADADNRKTPEMLAAFGDASFALHPSDVAARARKRAGRCARVMASSR